MQQECYEVPPAVEVTDGSEIATNYIAMNNVVGMQVPQASGGIEQQAKRTRKDLLW